MKLEARTRLLSGNELAFVLNKIAKGSVIPVSQYWDDPDRDLIASKGKDYTKVGKVYAGPAAQCHWNTAKLYTAGLIDSIVIGYGHNRYGWHQHTWGLKGNSVIETTEDNATNDHWFGVKLTPEQAKVFVVRCAKFKPGMGMIRTGRGGSL